MFSEPKNKRYIARTLASLLTALCIMVSGTVATAWQVRMSDRQEAALAARQAVSRIDNLLDEAAHATALARPYLTQTCSAAVHNELNRLAVRLPHMRVISLFQSKQLACSSFDVPMPLTIDISQYADNRLSLRRGNLITPNEPFIVLLSVFPEGSVTASIAYQHLSEILSMLSTQTPLSLNVGNQTLSYRGKLSQAKHLDGEHSFRSGRYPYAINYVSPGIPPLWILSERRRILFALFAAFSVLGGLLVWRSSFRQPSPYEQLALAVRRQEIIPWYQPVVCSQTGEIRGVEVLARWKHRSGNNIPPDEFIPLAEKSGLIIPLTRQLMVRAAKELAPVISRLRQPFHVAVNISAAHIRVGQLTVEDFRQFQFSFPEGSIQLVAEITEREPFSQFPDLVELLHTLRQQGVRIALDDFGTGYSSLGYLNTLPVDYIKIDRSFINGLSEGKGSDMLMECVISMARTLRLGIVAEGVETRYQAEWLTAHKVDFLQGYYFSRPLPVSGFIREAILHKEKKYK